MLQTACPTIERERERDKKNSPCIIPEDDMMKSETKIIVICTTQRVLLMNIFQRHIHLVSKINSLQDVPLLTLACYEGEEGTVKHLTSSNKDVNQVSSVIKYLPLYYAKNMKVVRLLLQAGAQVLFKNKNLLANNPVLWLDPESFPELSAVVADNNLEFNPEEYSMIKWQYFMSICPHGNTEPLSMVRFMLQHMSSKELFPIVEEFLYKNIFNEEYYGVVKVLYGIGFRF